MLFKLIFLSDKAVEMEAQITIQSEMGQDKQKVCF